MKKNIILFLLTTLIFSSCIKDPETYDNTLEGNFNALWKIIDTRYCYLGYKNINWDSIHTEYKKRLPELQHDKYAVFDLLGDMLAELKDGHVNLYSSFDVSRYDKWYTDSAANYYSSVIYSEDSEYMGRKYRIAGGLRYGILNKAPNVGYIYYGSFSNGFSNANVRNIFSYFKNCDGLILDVRDNGGGTVTYSEQLASYFFLHDRVTGYMRYKNGTGHNDFSQAVELKTTAQTDKSLRWTKPVIVLTNRYSYSATNDFVNRMKHADNALIIGSWTGGGGGMPLSSELPIGWMVRFSASPMFDLDMKDTENGIPPDYWVETTEEDEDNNRDAIIDKAIELINHPPAR